MPYPEQYTVGWICALSTEAVAAREFLDEEHPMLKDQNRQDNNNYILGAIGEHNVVIAALPNGQRGAGSAAGVVKDMLYSFPNIRICLVVGIGGGAPSAKHDIRLGDVVVGTPGNGHSGLLQFDFGKTKNKAIKITGTLNSPPKFLLSAVSTLKARYEADGHEIEESIEQIIQRKYRLRRGYSRPETTSDRLYTPHAVHPNNDEECVNVCGDNAEKIICRLPRAADEDNPMIHYGLIATGNQEVRDASVRDSLIASHKVLCFEMETAGIMSHFPCLVIRGISHYSDSHESKEWEGYAAMAAVAYAKDLLYQISPSKPQSERAIHGTVSSEEDFITLSQSTDIVESKMKLAKEQDLLNWSSGGRIVGNYLELLRSRAPENS